MEYSQYYMALCAIKQQQWDDAQNYLNNLLQKHKKWNKADDIYFQLALVHFERKDPLNALQQLKEIKNQSEFGRNINNMKESYLSKTNDVQLLKNCYAFNENDTAVAKVCYYKFDKNPTTKADAEAINKKFKFAEIIAIEKPEVEDIVDTYMKVAIIFPFMISDTSFSYPTRDVQFVYDYLEGFKIGIDSLTLANIQIDYATFDTKKDTAEINRILAENSFSDYQLIIGPVYNNQLNTFVRKNTNTTIPILHPFSKSYSLIDANRQVYLAEPSYETQATKLARFAIDSSKTGSIIWGGTLRDSIMAYTYKTEYEKLGGKIETMIKIHKVDFTNTILSIKKVDYTKTGHVLFFSSDEGLARNFISVVDMRNTLMPIYAYSDILDFNSITVEQFEKRFFRFVYPDYINYENPSYLNFKKAYIEKIGTIPSLYSYKGYEQAMLVSKILYNAIIDIGYNKGPVFTGFDYSGKKDNQVVPIVKLQNQLIVPLNYIPAESVKEDEQKKK